MPSSTVAVPSTTASRSIGHAATQVQDVPDVEVGEVEPRHPVDVERPQSEYGGVALSLPSLVGVRGVAEVVVPEMSEGERGALLRSAKVLDAAYNSMKG